MRNTWLLVGPRPALALLRPLIDAHARVRPVRVVSRTEPSERRARSESPQTVRLLHGLDLRDVCAVLLVMSPTETPATVLSAPFVGDGAVRVPVGVLPWTNDSSIERFATAAVAVQQRTPLAEPIALLGEWDPHVRRMVSRAQRILGMGDDATLTTLCWTADRLIRRDLIAGLGHGLAAAVYFGHGRPYGWCGYHGLHTRHLQYLNGKPLGSILSLTCNTAARGDKPLSFAEELVIRGITPAALAATAPTRTLGNWWWATRVCQVLRDNHDTTLGELTVAALPAKESYWRSYRIVGDPLTPLRGVEGAVRRCLDVYAPAPDAIPSLAAEE